MVVAFIPPILEAAAARVATALAGVLVGVQADKIIKARQESAEAAKSGVLAQSDAASSSKEKCPPCPAEKGFPTPRNTAGWSETTIEYQQRIGGMPAASPGYLTEWTFNDVAFDGFDPGQCLLKEAKAAYDNFFDEYGVPQVWWKGEPPLMGEVARQAGAAVPRPPVKLKWFFMEQVSYLYFSRKIRSLFPDIIVVHQP
ncbi:Tox-REase-5 domain-containing protein [Herbaspirillum robiniae]|uniref:Tox-REase-5 domain-containing protein n=2 Tax=Herbaspirillum robiniae TaxID=2014887 RepID=A0A246WR87_9BURK|nr:Tox-REase-5 domain-containing protein [Herbaspirillum robiniae]OWY28895.1 hypothetical protein CEJ42_13090 [Herbaspirillum robiniae]